MAGINAIMPVRGWVPDWYAWAQFGCGARRTEPVAPQDEAMPHGSPQVIHRKPTAAERMPVDVLLLKHNGELS